MLGVGGVVLACAAAILLAEEKTQHTEHPGILGGQCLSELPGNHQMQ